MKTMKTKKESKREARRIKKAGKTLLETFGRPASCDGTLPSTPIIDKMIGYKKVDVNLWWERSEEFALALMRRINSEKDLFRTITSQDNPKPGVDEAEMRGFIKGLKSVLDLYSSYFLSTGTRVDSITLRNHAHVDAIDKKNMK